MPRGSVSVICVEPWIGSVGAIRFGPARANPKSCTMTASAPAAAIAARHSTA